MGNKFSTFKTRILPILLNGSQTMSRLQFATFLLVDLRWPQPLLETPLPFKNFSNVFLINSQLCSDVRPFYIGILVKAWTKWNSPRPNLTFFPLLFLSSLFSPFPMYS